MDKIGGADCVYYLLGFSSAMIYFCINNIVELEVRLNLNGPGHSEIDLLQLYIISENELQCGA